MASLERECPLTVMGRAERTERAGGSVAELGSREPDSCRSRRRPRRRPRPPRPPRHPSRRRRRRLLYAPLAHSFFEAVRRCCSCASDPFTIFLFGRSRKRSLAIASRRPGAQNCLHTSANAKYNDSNVYGFFVSVFIFFSKYTYEPASRNGYFIAREETSG